jgi:hypothetical protein
MSGGAVRQSRWRARRKAQGQAAVSAYVPLDVNARLASLTDSWRLPKSVLAAEALAYRLDRLP